MAALLRFFISFIFYPLVSADSFSEFVYPNFTSSNSQFLENQGAFLFSSNGTFKAAIHTPGGQHNNFYLCVIHVASKKIIWSANRNNPMSDSGKMTLTNEGVRISDRNGNLKWSTPMFESSVSALMLTEVGNLVLLDHSNGSLWESFHHPTDTIVIGQELPIGTNLSSAVSDEDLSTGDYQFSISSSDAVLQWLGQTYWRLSMDDRAFINSDALVEYMALNGSGIYLYGNNGSVVVIQVSLSPSDFKIAKLVSFGQFTISSFSGSDWNQEFVSPADGCQVPSSCGKMGLCTDDTTSNSPTCSCPSSAFVAASNGMSGCVPNDVTYSLPVACDSANTVTLLNSSVTSYLSLGYGLDYFARVFSEPVRYGANSSVCQSMCSADCSCLGVLYEDSSGSCFVIENDLGSIIESNAVENENDLLIYIKVAKPSSTDLKGSSGSIGQGKGFPLPAVVLLPFTGFSLFVALVLLWWRRRMHNKTRVLKFSHQSSFSSGDFDALDVPGLPKKFKYEELEVATDHFKTQIGSGGFGVVYRGTLPDKTVVAVKKLSNLGMQGRKEFCAEISIIGNIHHVNLVRLRGFCAQGSKRLLVYEYMNRGSLARSLFGRGPVLEWQERADIAIGTARGLAYLHSGCEQKIIHCDIKPENILLHDHFQAKLSDFGLSKLLSPQQSSLFTTMRGTRGYLAPEWLTNSAISEKTDVYSYGMVLLELISGRKNCSLRSQSHSMDESNSGSGQSSSSSVSGLDYFPLFALEMHEQGRYVELADQRLEGRVMSAEVEKLARVALCCVQEEPALRPSMVTVVGMLEGGIPLGRPRMESLNFLRFYGRRFVEVENKLQSGDFVPYPGGNACYSSTTTGSNTCFSYISSQQISGPR